MFHDYSPALRSDLPRRWRGVQSKMSQQGLDGILVANPMNLLYLSGRIFYGFLYVPASGDPFFFVRRPAGLVGDRLFFIRKPEEIPALLVENGVMPPRRFALEADELPHSEWVRLSHLFQEAEYVNGSPILRWGRSIKSPYEVGLMKETGREHIKLFDSFGSLYRPGMTDQAWTIEIFHYLLTRGHLGLLRVAGASMEGFVGSVLVGENGGGCSPYDYALGGRGRMPALPVGQDGTMILPGTTALVDVPSNLFGYQTDCTRTYALGSLPQRAYDAHQVAIEIESTLAQSMKPGASCEFLYQTALQIADQRGFADCFMGLRQKARFVGHGTGLVINEWPVLGAKSKHVIEENQCIALEPKFVIEGVGAVGVEDTYLVTRDGAECLTESERKIRPLDQ